MRHPKIPPKNTEIHLLLELLQTHTLICRMLVHKEEQPVGLCHNELAVQLPHRPCSLQVPPLHSLQQPCWWSDSGSLIENQTATMRVSV